MYAQVIEKEPWDMTLFGDINSMWFATFFRQPPGGQPSLPGMKTVDVM